MTKYVDILNAALEERVDQSTGQKRLILRGVIDPTTLQNLLADDYQREKMPLTSIKSIMEAYAKDDPVPDVELGMRGMRYKDLGGGKFRLFDPTYKIDGVQRTSGAQFYMAGNPGKLVHLGATIHFGTTKEWERERFRVLNSKRLKVSSNVLLRNRREDSKAIDQLYRLVTGDKSFVMRDRVNWEQRQSGITIVSAMTYCRVIGMLHSHITAGRGNGPDEIVPQLDNLAKEIGINVLRDNVRYFFELVDECWNIRHIKKSTKKGEPQAKHAFLLMLARVLSDGITFWKGDGNKHRLFVEAQLRTKLKGFKLYEPRIEFLCNSSGASLDELYLKLREHFNKGKRTRKVVFRNAVEPIGDLASDETEEEHDGDHAAAA